MLSPIETPSSATQRRDADEVLAALDQFCLTQEPGTIVPSRSEWMNRLNASERSVRWAMEELRRQGKIVGRRTQIPVHPPPSHEQSRESSQTIVAVTIPDDALFDQAMKILVQQVEDAGFSVMCHLLTSGNVSLSSLPVMHQPAQGYIFFRRDLISLAEQFQASGQRVVVIGTPYAETTPKVPLIYGNQEHGGYLATRHLIELGHRRIAFCALGDYEKTLRWQGHRRALREAKRRGLPIEESSLDVHEIREWQNHPARGHAVFRGSTAPTGLVVWNDHEAAMVVGQLNRLGLHVPRDVSVVGYDNLREGQLLYPTLTTVHSPVEEQLQAAINLLTGTNPPAVPYQLLIQPTIICRESSAPPPVGSSS